MTTQLNAMKQALEFFGAYMQVNEARQEELDPQGRAILDKLRTAIEQMEKQEPVAEARFDGTLHWLEPYGIGLHRLQGPLYTAPPAAQRQWAVFCGGCRKEWGVPYPHPGKSICDDCEAKLKAKNSP